MPADLPPLDADAVTDAAVELILAHGDRISYGRLCPACSGWSHHSLNGQTYRDHARVCQPLRAIAVQQLEAAP